MKRICGFWPQLHIDLPVVKSVIHHALMKPQMRSVGAGAVGWVGTGNLLKESRLQRSEYGDQKTETGNKKPSATYHRGGRHRSAGDEMLL